MINFRVVSQKVPHRNCRLAATRNSGVKMMASNAVSPVHGVNVNVKCIGPRCDGVNARVYVSVHKHGLGTMMMGPPFHG